MADPSLEQKMLNQASAFIEGGARCGQFTEGTGPGNLIMPLPASVVCYAFSAELLLKLLLQITNGNVPRKHNLMELFNALPDNCKKLIRASYEKKASKPGSSLDYDLSVLGPAFVDWRYVYEAESLAINPQSLTQIVLALYTVSLDLKSDLIPPSHMTKYC